MPYSFSPTTPTGHWADKMARQLLQKNPPTPLVCAAGTSPSGQVHIGNFREAITVDFVIRAIQRLPHAPPCRYLFSWDDYDVFRKVPKNIPHSQTFKKHLRKPYSKIPDPFECHSNYAQHFEALFEEELKKVGIFPEFRYQTQEYESLRYTPYIQQALQATPAIRHILNRFRTTPLPENWLPITFYCPHCLKDTTQVTQNNLPTSLTFQCQNCHSETIVPLEKPQGIKLLWRIDWPMRWVEEKVFFEPGGKDHSSTGGSYETAAIIIQEVWQKPPPTYLPYDFVLIKGLGKKLSSSSGELITVSEALQVYEPQLLRYLFACRKPNLDFSISFDLDVLKAYDDFDRTERVALKIEETDDKKYPYESMVYYLSLINPQDFSTLQQNPPRQFAFRHLCNLVQIYEGDLTKVKNHYHQEKPLSTVEEKRLITRAQCAWNWTQKFAPEPFRFSLRKPDQPLSPTQFPQALKLLIQFLEKAPASLSAQQLHQFIYQTAKEKEIPPKKLFEDLYHILINKSQGPRLASFILTIGIQRAVELFKKALP